ncbi:inner nuclear membrane protein Man1-like [Panonychus citri]|uniref:inner nuclear membrane protein Man1-like n=1 Tax=Panonychus citri TaxID=50023 RepID=UPI00230826FB|nr:inner nuclear membrane protein Man1-like [Panonychus citri]
MSHVNKLRLLFKEVLDQVAPTKRDKIEKSINERFERIISSMAPTSHPNNVDSSVIEKLTVSEWTSYSIVGVFLLFFSIIAAFYLHSRMRFNIAQDLGPVSVSNLGVNLNELTLPVCDLEEKQFCTKNENRIKPSLLVFRYILNHIEEGLLDYYCSKESKRSDARTYSVNDIFKSLQAKSTEIDEKLGYLLPQSNNPSVNSKMLFADYFSEAISFISNYNLHLKVHSKNGEQFITVDKTYPISLSMGCKVRSFLWRFGKYTSAVLIIISIIFSIIQYISHKKRIQNEDEAAVQDLVKKSIDLLQSPDEPRSMPVINIRDTLLTPQQRKESRWKKIWSKVVELIENNDYHINSAIEERDGEEFKTWKWCGSSSTKDRLNEFRIDATTMRTGTIEWQGSAFDSTSDPLGVGINNQIISPTNGSINSVPKALTEFLKLRNIPNKNGSSSWKTQLRNAIIEKCTAHSPSKYHGILHIDFGSADKKELFIYLKCDSIESATNSFAALHGWWCERRLVSVKFLKADRYYEKFPKAAKASTPLKILNIDS